MEKRIPEELPPLSTRSMSPQPNQVNHISKDRPGPKQPPPSLSHAEKYRISRQQNNRSSRKSRMKKNQTISNLKSVIYDLEIKRNHLRWKQKILKVRRDRANFLIQEFITDAVEHELKYKKVHDPNILPPHSVISEQQHESQNKPHKTNSPGNSSSSTITTATTCPSRWTPRQIKKSLKTNVNEPSPSEINRSPDMYLTTSQYLHKPHTNEPYTNSTNYDNPTQSNKPHANESLYSTQPTNRYKNCINKVSDPLISGNISHVEIMDQLITPKNKSPSSYPQDIEPPSVHKKYTDQRNNENLYGLHKPHIAPQKIMTPDHESRKAYQNDNHISTVEGNNFQQPQVNTQISHQPIILLTGNKDPQHFTLLQITPSHSSQQLIALLQDSLLKDIGAR